MRNRPVLKSMLVALVVLAVPVAVLASGAIPIWNDFFCSAAEKRAMSEFAHFDGAKPKWESNAKVTGGCTTTFTVDGLPDEVQAYYEENLSREGWSVEVGPDNTFPIYLEADRDDLGYFLMFEGPDLADPLTREQVQKQKGVQVQAQDAAQQEVPEHGAVEPGKVRVSIQGGQQR